MKITKEVITKYNKGPAKGTAWEITKYKGMWVFWFDMEEHNKAPLTVESIEEEIDSINQDMLYQKELGIDCDRLIKDLATLIDHITKEGGIYD